jgi:hypothetical protein
LKDGLEEDEATGKVEQMKGPRGESFTHGGKEPLPIAISKSFIDKGNVEIFGRKGATCKSQDVGNMNLNMNGLVKKEELGFFYINVHS